MKKIIDIFKQKLSANGLAKTPEQRVKMFISHWYQQWSIAKNKMDKRTDFEFWGGLVSEVDGRNFIKGKRSGTHNVFCSEAEFDSISEKITECDITGNLAQVYTEKFNEKQKSSGYHVFELCCNQEGNWLISEIVILRHPPKSSVIDAARHCEILSMSNSDAPFIRFGKNLNLNESTLFSEDRNNISLDEKDQVKTARLGKFNLRSGVIGILDFGYDIYDFEPLHKRMEPGQYIVETLSIGGRVAGLRVRFNDNEAPVKWHAANTPNGNGVYCVDAGNLAIFDVDNLLSLSRIKKEKIFNGWAVSGQPQLLSMTEENDCIITSSGYGDGAYPAFWGVNKEDEVVSLYLDFMILVQEGEDGIYIST